MGKRFRCGFIEHLQRRFESQLRDLKVVLSHLGLYVGLIIYTAIGAWIFILLEHPVEKEKLQTLQSLLLTERENFLNLIYNLTSKLDATTDGISEEDLKSMLLATNNFRPQWESQEYYTLERMVRRVDEALLDYEQTVAVAAGEGINLTSKECIYKWDYTQSVFFSSTIITTVGYGNIAPSTIAGRVFCILFAIIGIPFTLSVLADVGQITATLISLFWAKAKPVLVPLQEKIKAAWDRFKASRRKKAELNADEEEVIDEEEDEEAKLARLRAAEEDPMANMGITANIIMGFVALGCLGVFLSLGSYVFTEFEDWTFFEAFYFCFITMTTIGFGDIVPNISQGSNAYMLLCMIYIIVGLAFTSTIIELVRRQYAESWRKMQELRAQIQAQLKLADHLRKMAEQGKDLEGMDVDLDQLRDNLAKIKKGPLGKFFRDINLDDLEWINKRNVKAVTILFYETSL